MVSVADNVIGHVAELKANKMWDNTIFVVSADNGGAPCMGSNTPLKGCKGTYFEGGIRSPAFANGVLLSDKVRGTTTEGFIDITDWHTTFCKLAGVDPSDLIRTRKVPSRWTRCVANNYRGKHLAFNTPHKEIMLGYNFTQLENGALIMGDYELIVNNQ